MARIALIDGENLLYGLRTLLGSSEGALADRSIFENFNFRGLIEDILIDELPREIVWFGARLRRYDHTPALLQKTTKAIYLQSKLVNTLQSQKITFIKVGYLRTRPSEACINCNHSEWKLSEKGVDVGLAVRVIQEANSKKDIILFSADTDLIPAVKVAKKQNSNVMFVGYEYQPINALSQEADTTRLITKPLAQKYFM